MGVNNNISRVLFSLTCTYVGGAWADMAESDLFPSELDQNNGQNELVTQI